jgi:hypothetical protein
MKKTRFSEEQMVTILRVVKKSPLTQRPAAMRMMPPAVRHPAVVFDSDARELLGMGHR